MATTTNFQLQATVSPPVPAGSATRQSYSQPSEIVMVGTTNGLAQIILTLDDFVAGSGSEPLVSIDLEYGTPYIDVDVTVGGGGESVASQVITSVDGLDPDLSKLRMIQVLAKPIDPDTASKIKAIFTVGDFTTVNLNCAALPISYDSTDAGNTPEAGGGVAIPHGITFASADEIKLTIFEALNVNLLILLQGK